MRSLYLIIFAVTFSSNLFAQNIDTVKTVSDTSLHSKVVVPISIQVADTVVKNSSVPSVPVDSLKVLPTVTTDTSAVLVPAQKKDSLAKQADVNVNPADTAVVSSVKTQAPVEPLDPNYIYSSLFPGMPLVKRNNKEKIDTIVMLNGDRILANVKKFTFKDLFYGFPGDQKMVQVDRRYVQKIIYKYGRVETISSREVEVREVGGWRDVRVLKKPTPALKTMVEVGEVEGIDEGTREKYVDAKDLERSATITLQKKASLLGATIVLITTRDVRRPYGDPPYVRLVGMAYKPR